MTRPEQPANGTPPSAEALRLLIDHHRQFLAFLERRVGSRAVAQDILQAAFVRGMGKLDGLRSQESAVAWFYRLLRNAVIDYRRRSSASERTLEAFAAEVEERAEPAEHTKSAICQCVAVLAGTLKPEYAEALRLVEVEGLSVKDFAERAGISSGNAAVRVFRARDALRKQVSRACGSCADHGCLDCTCGVSTSRAERNAALS